MNKPERWADGFYHFICEVCLRPFRSKSQRSCTCSQQCRNKKTRDRNNKKCAAEIAYTDKFKHNASTLRSLFLEDKKEPVLQVLDLLHYHFDILPEIEWVGGQQVRFFGEYGIIRLNDEKFKIIKKDGNR